MIHDTNNWLITVLRKDARRYRSNDRVRFFTEERKGRGKGIVLTPNFQKGHVVEYNPDSRRYVVTDGNQNFDVHPRNIVPDSFARPEPVVETPTITATPPSVTV